MYAQIDSPSWFEVLRRRWPLVFVVALVVGIAAAIFALAARDHYQSTAKLLFRQTIGPEQNAFGLLPTAPDVNKLARDFEQIVRSRDVAAAAAEELGRRGVTATPESVARDVSVTGGRDSDVITITARADTAEGAALLANAYARSAQRFAGAAERRAARRLARLVRAELRNASRRRSAATTQRLATYLERLEFLAAGDNATPRLIQRGFVPSGKAGDPLQTVVLGLIFGAILGSGLALVREQTDRRFRRSEDVVAVLGTPVLTTVPVSRELHRGGPLGLLAPTVAEAFRVLDANLRYVDGRPIAALAVCSQARGEGRSTVAWNLALAAARSGLRVVLVEGDMRHPVLARRHGLHGVPGLMQVLRGERSPLEVLQAVTLPSDVGSAEQAGSLHVLVAGGNPPDPWSLLQGSAAGPILDVLRGSHDLVVVDTPPLGRFPDALALLRALDGVLVVARIGETRVADAARLKGQLEAHRVRTIGAVANCGSIASGYTVQPIAIAEAAERAVPSEAVRAPLREHARGGTSGDWSNHA
ncbi:MAG: P-loop NTPase [Thermoleophilum sp.]|nr:P-loop NTPase [Thermoleophilum sp.]